MNDPYTKSPRSVSELTVMLHEAANREVDEFNVVYDRMEEAENKVATLAETNQSLLVKLAESRKENEGLVSTLRALEKGTDTIMSNANKHLQYAEQARREKDQMADKLIKADLAIAPYKVLGTAKKIREQIKSYKDKALVNQKAINAGKDAIKVYRADIVKLTNEIHTLKTSVMQSSIQTIWSENGDHLLMFPTPLTMEINGAIEKQLTLLFMNNTGCGKLIGIDELGDPILCQMPKGGLKPKAATLAKAGQVLRKFKTMNWVVEHKDLVNI